MTWSHLWPTPDQLADAMHDPAVYYKPAVMVLRPQVEHVNILLQHPAWAVWIMNPRLDYLVPGPKINLDHWLNMCLTPLHGPCTRAIHSLGHPWMHRLRCGELIQSHRPRYISGDYNFERSF
jgi:hypothetical protein